jgi:SPFH domain / Band 7 family
LTIKTDAGYRHSDDKASVEKATREVRAMADIKRAMFLRHMRCAPNMYVEHTAKAKLVHSGLAQSFWFRPLTASVSEVPVDDQQLPLLFHARTLDFQDLTVQATVTYRIIDPHTAAGRIDFGIDPDEGIWRSRPLDQLAGLLTESAQQHALDLLSGTPLRQALADGVSPVRERIAVGLTGDRRLAETGLEVVDVRVVALRSEAEMERALQTPLREQVQQEADRATYERRAVAVERERAITENELQSQIELARREEQLVDQQGRNARKRSTEEVAAEKIRTEADAERQQLLAQTQAEATRLVGMAQAEVDAAALTPYRDLDQAIVLGLALKELAANMPEIGTLNLTPDVLTHVLGRFAADRN